MKRPTMKQMKQFARPMVAAGDDYQAVQWEILNHFDGLTNSDEDESYTREAIRELEDEIAE